MTAAEPRRVARPAVLRRVSLDRHAIVEASAGTGKTFTLESLVVELLLGADVPLDRLLVVTFTEKATREIRARVRGRLEELCAGGGAPPDERQARDGDFWTIDARARDKLERALRAFDAATIATIHAFCYGVLRDNAFASGRLFDERQVDGREAFGRAFRDAVRRDVALDPARACWLEAALRGGWSMQRIEKLLWTCAAARGEPRPSFDPAALRAAIEAFPIDEARRPALEADLAARRVHRQTRDAVLKRLRAAADAVERARRGPDPTAFVGEAAAFAPLLSEKLPALSPGSGPAARVFETAIALARATPPFHAALAHALLEPIRDELRRSKRAAGQFDFDDMLSLVDEALQGPRGPALAEAIRRRWSYALVDEFQDTDETQWSIFRRAFFDPGGGPRGVAIFVGDPKQSIYRFRGADVDTYLRAREAVVEAGGARVPLDRNYRATRALVDATNRIFDAAAGEPMFTGAIAYEPVECGRPDRALTDGDGRPVAPVGVLRFRGEITLPELGRRIAAEVRAITDPARPWRLDGRALQPSDVFVLTRSEREGRSLGESLRAARVPHAFYRQDGLFQTDEARDVRALLDAIADPADRARRLAAWLTPFFGVPLTAIDRARDLPASHPLVARLHEWKALADARAFDRLFESVVAQSSVLRREIFFAEGERALTNYLHLLEALLERGHEENLSLAEMTAGLAQLIEKTRAPLDVYEGNVQRIESERRAVQIMTIHKAKGLEAPVVFVAGGFSPGGGRDDVHVYHEGGRRLAWVGALSREVEEAVKREEAEEDERLMYVALTRAMGRMVLPCVVEGDDAEGERRPGEARALRGPYARVNRRLVGLIAGEDPLFAVADDDPGRGEAPRDPAAAPAWSPPPALLRDDDDQAARYARLRERAAGPAVTSYTRLRGERRAPWGGERPEHGAEKAADALDAASSATLRGSRTSGVFLHELLERVPIASFGRAAGFDGWRAAPEVAATIDEAVVVHRVDVRQREHAERMVWTAYTASVALPGGDRIDGLARAARLARELEFVYPVAAPGPGGAAYVRGSLDLAFEHRGLAYFVDWKSDSLASYAPGALHGHVAAHYEDQVMLYTLAVAKLLGVRSARDYAARFGGLVYCFLRGLDGEGGGVWAARPAWDQVEAVDRGLGERSRPRGRAR